MSLLARVKIITKILAVIMLLADVSRGAQRPTLKVIANATGALQPTLVAKA